MAKTSLSQTSKLVKEKIKLKETYSKLPKRLSGKILDTFAIDLALVACSIRTGYLLDLFFPQNPVALFSRLLADLRADPRSEDAFHEVFHVYDPSSEQSFFVNAGLLSLRIQSLVSGDTERRNSAHNNKSVIFIRLSSPIAIIDIPDDVHELLVFLLSQSSKPEIPLACSLPSNTPVKSSVPLAAVLLDYPVAYVPSPSHDNILSGVPLDFYESSLSFHNNGSTINGQDDGMVATTVMKFSCPATLGQAQPSRCPELQPRAIIKSLNDMLLERLEQNKDSSVEINSIVHTTETLDHVAF